MEGNGDNALGVGVPETGKVSDNPGKVGGREALSDVVRSMMGGSCD